MSSPSLFSCQARVERVCAAGDAARVFPAIRGVCWSALFDVRGYRRVVLSYELDDEAVVAEYWARACPTLTAIILPKGHDSSRGEACRGHGVHYYRHLGSFLLSCGSGLGLLLQPCLMMHLMISPNVDDKRILHVSVGKMIDRHIQSE